MACKGSGKRWNTSSHVPPAASAAPSPWLPAAVRGQGLETHAALMSPRKDNHAGAPVGACGAAGWCPPWLAAGSHQRPAATGVGREGVVVGTVFTWRQRQGARQLGAAPRLGSAQRLRAHDWGDVGGLQDAAHLQNELHPGRIAPPLHPWLLAQGEVASGAHGTSARGAAQSSSGYCGVNQARRRLCR